MMVLNSGTAATTDPGSISRPMVSNASMRRRRSKGTIAGFTYGKGADSGPKTGATTPAATSMEAGADPADPAEITDPDSSTPPTKQALSESSATALAPAKPCHSARLALLCTHNSIKMGARTQLGLCPPGRARRSLQAALRQRIKKKRSNASRRTSTMSTQEQTNGYFGLERMIGPDSMEDYVGQEEDYLLNSNTFDVESDEDASSGDEDDIGNIEDLTAEDTLHIGEETKYQTLEEPLFVPNGAEALSGSNGGSSSMMGTGKLPFNLRKLRYFDAVTASDRMAAREYLRQESRRSKKRDALILSKHLRRMQRQQRMRVLQAKGEPTNESEVSDDEADTRDPDGVLAGVGKLGTEMTPALSAALLIESLSMNPRESVEGMSKCYDGIVAAGVALLDANLVDSAAAPSENGDNARTRSEIMAALAPLLITSLEQPSGEVIFNLAKLRQMCGTPRYQRRFVQRVAPSLIRPPNAAMWCLQHRNDIEPIFAAAELIFDNASDVFGKGWYERGRLILADSKRAETLNAAAMQLRNLSTGPHDHLTLSFVGHGHSLWRGNKRKTGSTPSKDPSKNASEPLAEWEVIAVDRQIRISLSNVFSTDWSRVAVQSKDSDLRSSYHRSGRSSSSKRNGVLTQSHGADNSPKSILASPLSPVRHNSMKRPTSPSGQMFSVSSMHSDIQDHMTPSPPQNPKVDVSSSRSASPIDIPLVSPSMPLSPPSKSKSTKVFDDDIKQGVTQKISPRAPASPKREPLGESVLSSSSPTPSSPKASSKTHAKPAKQSISGPSTIMSASGEKDRAPLSPSAGSGIGGTIDYAPHRPISSASSVTSSVGSGSQPAHYRMLTSSAAERKRTVAACRALRAQITRFEEAFVQLHGRPPKGQAERAPLATTYAQYREWKRAIRADAACRIQALFRGASTRWLLLRSNNPKLTNIIQSRAGRNYVADTDANPQVHSTALKQLSIPVEIDNQSDMKSTISSVSGFSAPPSQVKSFGEDGEKSLGPGTVNQPLVPQWGRRSSGSDGGTRSPIPKPLSSSSVPTDDQSLAELQSRKRELKQQLKQYDMNFARKHGRMPVKVEKEPIRHLYESYNQLKSQITRMEQEGRQPGGSNSNSSQPSPSPVLPQRSISGADSDDSHDPSSRIKRKHSKPPFDQTSSASTISSGGGSSTSATGSAAQRLATLKAEKQELHQMLRSYEKNFFKEHNRQVSSFADIQPVASQYRRYKEIKRAISSIKYV